MLSSPCISVCKSGITEIESEDCETDNAQLGVLEGDSLSEGSPDFRGFSGLQLSFACLDHE